MSKDPRMATEIPCLYCTYFRPAGDVKGPAVLISLHICREARAKYIPVNKIKYPVYIRGATKTPTTTQIDLFLDRQEEDCIFLWKIN